MTRSRPLGFTRWGLLSGDYAAEQVRRAVGPAPCGLSALVAWGARSRGGCGRAGLMSWLMLPAGWPTAWASGRRLAWHGCFVQAVPSLADDEGALVAGGADGPDVAGYSRAWRVDGTGPAACQRGALARWLYAGCGHRLTVSPVIAVRRRRSGRGRPCARLSRACSGRLSG